MLELLALIMQWLYFNRQIKFTRVKINIVQSKFIRKRYQLWLQLISIQLIFHAFSLLSFPLDSISVWNCFGTDTTGFFNFLILYWIELLKMFSPASCILLTKWTNFFKMYFIGLIEKWLRNEKRKCSLQWISSRVFIFISTAANSVESVLGNTRCFCNFYNQHSNQGHLCDIAVTLSQSL